MADSNLGLLVSAIKTTQELRSNVSLVFERLGGGLKDSDAPIGKQKAYLAELGQTLLAVNKDLDDLERLGSTITPSSSALTLGNASMLTLDPTVDKPVLYSQLIQSYKWSNKMHDHVNLAATLLHQNTLKRSYGSSGLLSAKRGRSKLFSNSHSMPTQIVDASMKTLDQLFHDMSITLSRPMGAPAILQVSLGRTLRAIVVLRGLIIEWVVVRGFGEPMETEDGKIDIWSKSKHAVFQKVTDHTSAAMLHFISPMFPELAVRSFMTWLHSYVTLFTTPCHKCGKYLRDNLPPTWRDFLRLDAYHEHCRP